MVSEDEHGFNAAEQRCEPCGAGEECSESLSLACRPCPAGHYKPAAGSAGCSACPVDSYRQGVGATELSACRDCPEFSTTRGSTGQVDERTRAVASGEGDADGSERVAGAGEHRSLPLPAGLLRPPGRGAAQVLPVPTGRAVPGWRGPGHAPQPRCDRPGRVGPLGGGQRGRPPLAQAVPAWVPPGEPDGVQPPCLPACSSAATPTLPFTSSAAQPTWSASTAGLQWRCQSPPCSL